VAAAATDVDTPAVLGQAPTLSLTPWPTAARPVTLGEAAQTPVPRSWLVIGVAIVVGALLLGLVLAVVGGGHRDERADAAVATAPVPPLASPAPAAPAAPVAKPVEPPVAKPAPPPKPEEPVAPATVETPAHDAELKALLRQLDAARTCADRRAAIPKLVALGDARAIAPLKAARVKKRGGFIGIGAENINGCLYADADAAAKKLSTPR
jgi:type IV secretory pathway VirB10-like protein